MASTRKIPHCKTCHKPLKGHKRVICETSDAPHTTSTDAGSPTPTRKRPIRKSAPLPLETLPTLSPHSSQILNNLLRTSSRSAPAPIQLPAEWIPSTRPDAESLHVAFEHLSASDREKSQMPCTYPATESEDSDVDALTATQASSHTASQQLTTVKQEPAEVAPSDIRIENFLDNTTQSAAQHLPATIFSFPANAVPALQDGAHRLGLFVRVLPMPSASERWVPVVVGKEERAVAKLVEDSMQLTQAVWKSGASGAVGEFHVGISHVVAGTLGALATWAGLAYS